MKKNTYMTISIILVALALFSRIIPHAPNFTPLISIVLVSSMLFKGKKYILIPILGLFISDVLLDIFYLDGYLFSYLFFSTYASLILIFAISFKFKNSPTLKNITIHSFLGAFLFFITSNFSVWLLGGYSYDFSGIITCYMMAIPFFKNTLLSTLIYSFILFLPALYKQYDLTVNKEYS